MSYRDDVSALSERCAALEQDAAATLEALEEARTLLARARARQRLPLLDSVRIAAPCSADWSQMKGDDHVRHCEQCDKSVYDLSSLTRARAEALLIEKEGKLCARLYRRADGTVLTADCPEGVKRRNRKRRVVTAAFTAMSAVSAAAMALTPGRPHGTSRKQSELRPERTDVTSEAKRAEALRLSEESAVVGGLGGVMGIEVGDTSGWVGGAVSLGERDSDVLGPRTRDKRKKRSK